MTSIVLAQRPIWSTGALRVCNSDRLCHFNFSDRLNQVLLLSDFCTDCFSDVFQDSSRGLSRHFPPTHPTWLVPSRPRASPPAARPPASSWPPRPRASPRPPPAASRSPTATAPVPLRCVPPLLYTLRAPIHQRRAFRGASPACRRGTPAATYTSAFASHQSWFPGNPVR